MSFVPQSCNAVDEAVVPTARPRVGSERMAAAALALAVLVVNTLTMPRLFTMGDPHAWKEEAVSLLLEGTLAVPESGVYSVQDPTQDGQYFVRSVADGRWYSKYGVMNSLMFVPPMAVSWALGRHVPAHGAGVDVLAFGVYYVVLSVASCLLLFRVTRAYSTRPFVRAAYVVACFYGTYLWFYQRAQYSELYQVLFFTAAFHFLTRVAHGVGTDTAQHLDRRALMGAWAAIAALVLTRVVYVFLLPLPFIALAASGGIGKRFRLSVPRRDVLSLLIPPVLIVALLAIINAAKFGAPWLSGYHQWDRVQGLDGQWRHALLGLLVSARWSVLLYFPPLALSLLGARKFVQRHRADAIVMYFALAAVLAFVAKMSTWRGEWSYGPRYLLFALPVVSLPFLIVLDDLVEHGSHAVRWLGGALVAIVLGYSATLQAQVAQLDFWAWYGLRLPLRGAMSDGLAKYFYEQPEGEICRDLLSHRDDLGASQLMQAVRAESPPQFAAAYGNVVSKVVRNTNLYWWPPEER